MAPVSPYPHPRSLCTVFTWCLPFSDFFSSSLRWRQSQTICPAGPEDENRGSETPRRGSRKGGLQLQVQRAGGASEARLHALEGHVASEKSSPHCQNVSSLLKGSFTVLGKSQKPRFLTLGCEQRY